MVKHSNAEETEVEAGPVTETITYVPGRDDPSSVKWAGQTFHANVPKTITGHPNGSEAERLNHHIITSAPNNPAFTVGGEGGGEESERRAPRRSPGKKVPKTAEEYRAHLAKWLQDPDLDHPEKLISRFAKERDLQAACEVGSQDYEMIGQLLMARLGDLQKHAEMTEQQVARVWLNHGYNQLPW